MRRCLRKYNALPALTYSAEGIGYVDGDSRGCRVLHSEMASNNLDHCPHVTFEHEMDVNGYIKCSQSAFVPPDEPFTSEEVDFIMDVGVNQFGYPADSPGGVINHEACPGA